METYYCTQVTTTPPNPNLVPPSYSLLGFLISIRLAYELTKFISLSASSLFKTVSLTPLSEEEQRSDLLLDQRNISSLLKPVDVFKPEDNENTILEVSQLSEEERSSRRCALCLEGRTSSCATECGHLFCWSCISSWGQEKVISFILYKQLSPKLNTES